MIDLQELSQGIEELDSLSSEILRADERLMPLAFYKKYHNFKIGHISNKFKQLSPDMQLPFNSCLHILNNYYNLERGLLTTDLPDIDHPFIKNETSRKFIYHVRQPNVHDGVSPIQLPDIKYVYLTAGLDQNLRKFRSEYNTIIKHIQDIESIPQTPTTLTVINHNPIFRTRVRGILPVYKKFLVLLGSILNTASKIDDKKTQYILFPLGPHVYLRDMFRLAEKEIKPTAIRVKTDYHYFLMMHWLNFLNPYSDQSLILKYPENKWDKTVFLFYYGSYFMMWSLSDIVRLNEKNRFYNRLINQFNSLVLTGMGMEVPDDSTESELTDIASDTTAKVEGEPDKEQDIQKQEAIQKRKEAAIHIQKEIDDVQELTKSLTKSIVVGEKDNSLPELKYNVVKKVNIRDKDDEEVELPEVSTDYIEDEPIQEVETVEEVATAENTNPDTIDIPADQTSTSKVVEVVSKNDTLISTMYMSGDLSKLEPVHDPSDVELMGTTYIEDIDEGVTGFIEQLPNLTNKQKEKLYKLGTAYKDIQIGKTTVEEAITAPVNVNVSENTVEGLDDYLPDASMKNSSSQTFDIDYMHNLFKKHLAEVAVSFNKQGMFLTNIEEMASSDELNRVIDYKLSFQDYRGKKHKVKFTLPLVDKDGNCYINGTKQYFRTQMTNLPICKVSPVRVSLASSYNKTVVERNTNKAHSFLPYLQRLISKAIAKGKGDIILEYGTVKDTDIKLPYEYAEISNIYRSMTIIDSVSSTKYMFDFNHKTRFDTSVVNLTDKQLKYIRDTEKKLQAIYLGAKLSQSTPLEFCFMTQNSILKVVDQNGRVLVSTTLIDMLASIFEVSVGTRLVEWTDIKILDKKFPVGFLLAYKIGFTKLLTYLGMSYKLVDRPARTSVFKPRPTDIILTFKDKYLVIPRYPLRNSLIIAGLMFFDLTNYNFSELDVRDTYYSMLLDKKFNINYLKGIDDTFDLFIDPMTREVLLQMNEPTNFRDLLIRATDMVSNNYHKEASSITNFRYRSYERFNSIVYNELSRQFASFTKKKGINSTFSINPNAVFLKIIQDSSMVQCEDINPIHDIKINSQVVYTGQGGRTNDSFVVNDRRFPKDGLGVLSEATVDNKSVGISAQKPVDGTVANLYGMFDSKDPKDLNTTQILSVTSMTMPGVTNDDGKRAGYCNIQLSHAMATKESDCMRFRTGYEAMIAHRCSDMYAVSAKQNGKVIDINDKAKMCKIQYEDGSIHTFTFGEEYGNCPDIITTQKQELTVKLGDTFKKDEILCYNPQFFEKDLNKRQVYWKHGISATIAFMEIACTFEDSSTVTKEFGEKISIQPVQMRMITVDKNTYVYMTKHIGDIVDVTDDLLIFEDANTTDLAGLAKDDDTLDYLSRLNRSTPKAKFAGKVVKMEMYTGCPVPEMHPTLQELYKEVNSIKRARHNFSTDTSDAVMNPNVSVIPKGTKFKGVTFDKNTVVIMYYIQETLSAGIGDKIVIDSALKTVISDVLDEPVTTESGIPIDIIFSNTSVSNRMVLSPMIMSNVERILIGLEKQCVDIWDS